MAILLFDVLPPIIKETDFLNPVEDNRNPYEKQKINLPHEEMPTLNKAKLQTYDLITIFKNIFSRLNCFNVVGILHGIKFSLLLSL